MGKCRQDLQNSLFEEYAPSTPTQRELVQQLVQIFWKQRRIYSAENAIAQCEVAQIDDLRKKIWDDDKYELTPGEETSCNAIAGNVESERLIRYDAHLSRRLIRTLGLLHQLKVLENSKIINN